MTTRNFQCEALNIAYSKLLNTLDPDGKKFAEDKPFHLVEYEPGLRSDVYKWRTVGDITFYRTYDQIIDRRFRYGGVRTPEQRVVVHGLWKECQGS